MGSSSSGGRIDDGTERSEQSLEALLRQGRIAGDAAIAIAIAVVIAIAIAIGVRLPAPTARTILMTRGGLISRR